MAVAGAGLHLHDHQFGALLRNDVQLVPAMPPVALKHLEAMLFQEAARQLLPLRPDKVVLRHVWK